MRTTPGQEGKAPLAMRTALLSLTLLLTLSFVAPAWADDGACAPILHHDVRVVGRQILVSVLVELQSPGSVYVCVDLPDDALTARVALRRKVPNGSGYPDPVIDSCVSLLDMGSHPGDGFARVMLTDRAGGFQCLSGRGGRGGVVPARTQVFHVSWYVTPATEE